MCWNYETSSSSAPPAGLNGRAELPALPGPRWALASTSQNPVLLLPPGHEWVLWPWPAFLCHAPLPSVVSSLTWLIPLHPGNSSAGFLWVRFSPPHCRIVVLQFQSLACLLNTSRSWTRITDVSRSRVLFRWFKDPPKNWCSRRSYMWPNAAA